MFSEIEIINIDLTNLDFSEVTNMSEMFSFCKSLKSIKLSNINLSLVKDMSLMFFGCNALTSIEINNINTPSLINMHGMFGSCTSLESLDLSAFNTSLVRNMSFIFVNCNKLNNLNLRYINTSSVTDMSFMFYGCSSLYSIDLSQFNTSNVINMEYIFEGCSSFISLNLSNFNTSLVLNMECMFNSCISLKFIYINNYITSSVENMKGMFYNCLSLVSLDLSNFNTIKVKDMSYMFNYCESLQILNIENFHTEGVIYMDYMFYGCNSLISLNLYNFKTTSLNVYQHVQKIIENKKTIYCLNNVEFTDKIKIPSNIINNCSDFCFINPHKIIYETKKCIDYCINDNRYKFEYNNICYSSCPFGTYENNYTCNQTLTCENFYNYNHTQCLEFIPEGYYLNDSLSKTLDRCHINCKTCNKKDNETNTNCLTCQNNLFLDFGNCVTNCTRGYFTDSSNSNICKCPHNEKCNLCSNENIENDLCITCDNDGGFYEKYQDNVNKSSFINCYQKEEGYYLDNNILKPCYESCKVCKGEGSINMHNCLTCKENYTFINDSFYIENNCYPKCDYYYYFDVDNNYNCTLDNNCPDNYKNLIIEKNKCIDNCSNDNIYIYEYNNTCYDICPNGTHNTTDSFICEKDLICEYYYNYTHDGCLDYIPQGYYLNDSIKKTIDKCNIKCNNCTNDSMNNNLCISCNNEDGYYPKFNDSSNIDSFIECYNNAFEGYFLDITQKIYNPCYSTCKTCNESGDIDNNNCIKCYNNYTLMDSNCYEICKYYYYFNSSNNYQCTKENKCPENYKLIIEKKKCIDECKKDDKYKFEYNNTCFSYLICENYYNYNHTECLNEIPEGFYLNDSSLKTIDKCNNKCSNCSLESMQNYLCISCNNNGGFYQIINDSNNLNQNEFVDCYNSTIEGYYLDISLKAFKPCYMSCKKCDEIGNISDNKCIDCYQDYFLENGNCYKNCTYYHYFDFNKIYNCTENNECPNQFNNLIVEKKQCIDICKNDNIYKYQYNNTCYIKCPKGTISNNYICKFYNTSSTLENWNIEDFFSGNYNQYFGEEQNSEINDKIINSIREDILNGNIDLTNLTNGSKSDLLIQLYDTYYQITSSDNQNNNQYSNLSSINLGECENILKEIYKIDKNLPLIIFKVDYFKSDSKVPVIGYEIFHPITKEKLDTTYCKDELINFNIPVSIDENNLFKYDPNNDYYTDKCISYSSDGKDMLLNDRQNEFNNNNMSLCENSCEFIGYEKETKKAICECEMKYQQLIISNISTNSEIFYNNFSNNNVFSNTMTMKCYYTLFTKEGLTKNIGSYIFIFIIALFITTGIFYYKCGHRILEDDMCEILKSKEKDEKSKSTTIIKSSKTKKKNKNKNKRKKSLKHSSKKIKNILSNSNSIMNQNTSSKSNIKNSKYLNFPKDKIITTIDNNENKIIFTEYELNTMSYKKALKYDKRKFINYYISLIRTKHPLIFTFCPIKDYNSRMIKLSLFILFVSFHFTTNTFFFNESTFHKIYLDNGIYNFPYFLPYIILSFLISHILITIIKIIILSERNICEIKNEKTYNKASMKITKVKRCLVFKYIIYYVVGVIVLAFLWYYLSTFGAVYKNTQIYLIKNTAFSIILSFIYPFIINILPGIFRFCALNNSHNKKSCLYKFNLIIQNI